MATVAIALAAGVTASAGPIKEVHPTVHGLSTTKSRTNAVNDLLQRRAQALQQRDEIAFLNTIDPYASAQFRNAQRELFVNLAAVPLAVWQYQLTSTDSTTVSVEASGISADDLWAPEVELRYALTGGDAIPTTRPMNYLFSKRESQWFLFADSNFSASTRRTWRGPWDFSFCVVLTTSHGLVIGHQSNQKLVQQLAHELGDAVTAVTQLWKTAWVRRVVIILPETVREFQEITGAEPSFYSAAALTIADHIDYDQQLVFGPRIVFNPLIAHHLSPEALRIVLRHEITHVAARTVTADGAPLWLLEGFADYVGYRGTQTPLVEPLAELYQYIQGNGLPTDFPSDSEFFLADKRASIAYQSALSLMCFLAEKHGEAGLLKLYHNLARKAQPTPAVIADALQESFGLTKQEVLAGWQEFLRQKVASR